MQITIITKLNNIYYINKNNFNDFFPEMLERFQQYFSGILAQIQYLPGSQEILVMAVYNPQHGKIIEEENYRKGQGTVSKKASRPT